MHAQEFDDVFTDNMVLQRDEPIMVWGKGNPKTRLEVQFAGKKESTVVNSEGKWCVQFAKQPATPQPRELKVVSSEETIVLKNILIGDVWLLIGQSNMEWPMRGEMHYEEAITEARNNLLRFFNPKYIGKNIYGKAFDKTQMKKLKNGNLFYDKVWQASDTTSFKAMSAVGYYFGKKIVDSQNIPVGLINLSIGGAPIEAFIDEGTLKANKKFAFKIKDNWLKNDVLPVWVRERGKENLGANPISLNHAYKPGFVFYSGIAPMLNMPIKGILWYQGESNAQEKERVEEYPDLQKLLIEDYREKWKNPNLPYYWVQLSSIDTINYNSHFWPEFRDGQRRLLEEMTSVGMVVSSDIGARHDVHPTNKKAIGNRLSRWALKKVYEQDILVSGPLAKKAIYKNGSVVVDFNYTGRGLKTSDGKSLQGFSIDGKSGIPAKIKKHKVYIKTSKKSEFIYYNWQPWATGNLTNKEGIPASTFKLEVVIK